MRNTMKLTARGAWLAAALLLAALAGCVNERPRETWTDPAWHGPPLRKVMVAAIQNSDGRRRLLEDSMALAFKTRGIDAVPSYSIVPASQPSVTQLNEVAAREGYDGLVVNHLISTATNLRQSEGQTSLEPETVLDSQGHAITMMRVVHEAGEVHSEQTADYQTDVYATGQGGRLVWTAATRVHDPGSVKGTAQRIAAAVVPSLQAAGTLSGAPGAH